MASSKKNRPAPLSAAVRLSVPGEWHLPPLTVRAGRSELTAGPVATSSTDHRYLDTADLRLLAVGVTLSRRAGGEAPGWLLELPRPGGGASTVRLPLRGPSVAAPRQLSGLLRATVRGSRLVTVARLHVDRVVHPLVVQVPRDAAGADAAEAAGGPEGDGALFAPDGPASVAVVVLELVDVVSTATLTLAAAGDAGDPPEGGAGAAPVEVVSWRELELRPVGGELPVKDKHLGSFAQEVLDQLVTSGADVVDAGGSGDGAEEAEGAGADHAGATGSAGDGVPLPRPGDELRAVLARSAAQPPVAAGAAAPEEAPAPSAGEPAGEVVALLIRSRLEELLAADRALRGDEEGALTGLTAAARRLDAALALVPTAPAPAPGAAAGAEAGDASGPGSAPADPAALRADLAAVLTRLEAHADAVAVHAEVEALLRSEPPEQVLGPVAARTTLALDRADRAAAAAATRALGDARYFAVLDGVEALLAGGLAGPEGPAKKVLPAHGAEAHHRLADAVEALDGAGDQQAHDALLLSLRTALREAAATARVLAPVLPEADRYADGLDEVEPLVRAAVVAGLTRVQLRQLGVQAHLAGENGYSYGRLDAIAQEHGELAAEAAEEAWEQASRGRRRRWFS